MTTKLILSSLAAFITGAGIRWQMVEATDPLDARLWIGMFFSGAGAVGTYFGGLAQRAPWAPPALPTRTEETTAKTESPSGATTTTDKKVTTTDPPPKGGTP